MFLIKFGVSLKKEAFLKVVDYTGYNRIKNSSYAIQYLPNKRLL